MRGKADIPCIPQLLPYIAAQKWGMVEQDYWNLEMFRNNRPVYQFGLQGKVDTGLFKIEAK